MARGHLGAVVQHLHKLVGPEPGGGLTDGQLLERFVAWQEEAAFESLVRRHGALVLRVCRRVLDDLHAADDAFQATFLVLARKARNIGKRDSVGSWLYGAAYRIARKAKVSEVRRQRRETRAAVLPRPEPAGDGKLTDLKPLLDEELGQMSAKYRAPLVLCYLEGKTYGQAARELGWSEGSMSRRLAQARERLRQRLVRRGVALSTACLGALLTQSTQAAVAPGLIEGTTKAALTFAAGRPMAAGTLSEAAQALAREAVQQTCLFPLKTAATVLLALAAASAGIDGPRHRVHEDPSGAIPIHAVAMARGLGNANPVAPPGMDGDDPENLGDPEEMMPEDISPELPDAIPLPPAQIGKRRNLLNEQELRQQLLDMPELSLDRSPARKTSQWIIDRSRLAEPQHLLPRLIGGRPDLAGLPILADAQRQRSAFEAQEMDARSRDLRWVISEALSRNTDRGVLPEMYLKNFRSSRYFKENFRRAAAIPVLEQHLTPEDAGVREALVEQLALTDGPEASNALARLALFDLSAEVRAAAVQALARRPRGEFRQALLDGFRYPWAPVADHAAEALVELGEREVVGELNRLAQEPDPAAPTFDPQRQAYVVREVVRVNHQRNCLMCHAPSRRESDRGAFVRADVTYLRQDFAVPQSVEGPELERFDYLVRARALSFEEYAERVLHKPVTYPQREAVRFALKELTSR
jgi:RNA polymerase sigma factor (sigma-70 family)